MSKHGNMQTCSTALNRPTRQGLVRHVKKRVSFLTGPLMCYWLRLWVHLVCPWSRRYTSLSLGAWGFFSSLTSCTRQHC